MDFTLSSEQSAYRDKVRSFARKHVAPLAARWDEEETFPREILPLLGDAGLLGVTVPRAWGGQGLDLFHLVLAIEEIARYDGSLALALAAHHSIVCGHLLLSGTEAQKDSWLPRLTGGAVGAWALAEGQACSDASSIKTEARSTEAGWSLWGSKMFVTQAPLADIFIVLAMTGGGARHNGISAFLVEAGAAGLRIGKPLHKMGCRATETAPVGLHGVEVGSEALLGELNGGFRDAMRLLDAGRVVMGAMAVGLARGCLEEATSFARKRRQFGRPIGQHQAIGWMLADMATETDAARLLVHRAAAGIGQGRVKTREAAMAKLFAAETASRVANKAVQVHGGYGYLRSSPVERYLRDVKLCEIGEGTSEVQRLVIGRDILKG